MKKLVLVTICACVATAIFAQSAETTKKDEAQAPIKKKLLAATWKASDATYAFDKSGTSQVIINNRTCPGTWALDGKTLTITPKKLMWKQGDPCSKTIVLEVKSLSATGLEVIEATGQKELHLTKQK
jgi:hypothetical protein